MTKEGYTHVLIPTSLHSVLKCKAKDHNISIWRVIEDGVLGVKPPAHNRAATGSNPVRPIIDFWIV